MSILSNFNILAVLDIHCTVSRYLTMIAEISKEKINHTVYFSSPKLILNNLKI